MGIPSCVSALSIASIVVAACSSAEPSFVLASSSAGGTAQTGSSTHSTGTTVPTSAASSSGAQGGEGGASSIASTVTASGTSGSSGSADGASSTTTGTSSSSSSSSGGTTEPPNMAGMLEAHNMARANVSPAANPALPSMTWSATVAASAQAFTDNCVFADTGPPYGSNAFAGTGTYDAADVVAAWVSERANYDYATNSCAPGKQCGHYTQVVWRTSIELGCGMTTCTANNPFGSSGTWQLWVCNYNPAGNYVGEQPY